jgi:hypothetical protein
MNSMIRNIWQIPGLQQQVSNKNANGKKQLCARSHFVLPGAAQI